MIGGSACGGECSDVTHVAAIHDHLGSAWGVDAMGVEQCRLQGDPGGGNGMGDGSDRHSSFGRKW